jgi:hypothetical protein
MDDNGVTEVYFFTAHVEQDVEMRIAQNCPLLQPIYGYKQSTQWFRESKHQALLGVRCGLLLGH